MGAAVKITGIECYAVRLPLVTPFIIAYVPYAHVESVLVRLATDTGLVGWRADCPRSPCYTPARDDCGMVRETTRGEDG